MCWTTGEEVVPLHKAGHFSLDNYGDRAVIAADGSTRIEKRASALLPSVNNLTHSQWFDIVAASKKHAFNTSSESSVSPIVTSGDEDDFLLVQSESEEGEEEL